MGPRAARLCCDRGARLHGSGGSVELSAGTRSDVRYSRVGAVVAAQPQQAHRAAVPATRHDRPHVVGAAGGHDHGVAPAHATVRRSSSARSRIHPATWRERYTIEGSEVIERDPARVLEFDRSGADRAAADRQEVRDPARAGPVRIPVLVVLVGRERRVHDHRTTTRIERHVPDPRGDVRGVRVVDQIGP